MDPNSQWQRMIDNKLCPKDKDGNYTRNNTLCHNVHMAWHKRSEQIDKKNGGTGEYDRQRYEAHKNANAKK